MQRTTLPFEQAWEAGQAKFMQHGAVLPEILGVLRMVFRSVNSSQWQQVHQSMGQ